jgi:rhodanese-related sulfurtransferase
MGLIIVGAAILGLVVNHLRPDGIPLVANWSVEARLEARSGSGMVISFPEAEKAFREFGTVFLDARPPADFHEGHIAGALNLPWQQFDQYFDRHADNLRDDLLIIAYCDGESCALSEEVAKALSAMGYKNVRVLVNGWVRWVEAGLPTEKGTP